MIEPSLECKWRVARVFSLLVVAHRAAIASLLLFTILTSHWFPPAGAQQAGFNLSGRWYGGAGWVRVVQTGKDIVIEKEDQEYPTEWRGKLYGHTIQGTWACPKIKQKGTFTFKYDPNYKPGYMERIGGTYYIEADGSKDPRDFYEDREIAQRSSASNQPSDNGSKTSTNTDTTTNNRRRTGRVTFRRTGPFIQQAVNEGLNRGCKIDVGQSQIVFTTYMDDGAKTCTISFSVPPERISVGDILTLSGQMSGDENAYVRDGCWAYDGGWISPFNKPIGSEQKLSRYVNSTTTSFEEKYQVRDMDAMINTLRAEHKLPPNFRMPPRETYLTFRTNWGHPWASVEWKYVLEGNR